MPANATKKVKTLTEVTAAVEKITAEWNAEASTANPWFRGQANANWRLIPGLYREGINSSYEREIVRDFRLHSHLLIQHTPQNYFEWLFLMQHYGMPTRLIDWSESYLAALYFAIANRGSTTNGAVWVLDPWSLNGHAISLQSVPTADNPVLAPYALALGEEGLGREIGAGLPVAVRPPRANPRINAQRGSFTLHGSLKTSLDAAAKSLSRSNPQEPVHLRKIIIDGKSKARLRRELYTAGVTESVLFPDLEGLSREISYRYSREFMMEDDARAKGGKRRPARGASKKGAPRPARRKRPKISARPISLVGKL
jgi:hypothetical protein